MAVMNTFDSNDHPRNHPSNAGRFSDKVHSDPEGALSVLHIGPHDPIGYTYKAENYTPSALAEVLIRNGELSPGARGMTAENALDQLADATGVDRDDEYSFESDDFPKVITGDMVSIADAPWLGREYFAFDDWEPHTAQDALDVFAESLDLPQDEMDLIWDETDYTAGPAAVLDVLRGNIIQLGLDVDTFDLPTQYNAPAPAGTIEREAA